MRKRKLGERDECAIDIRLKMPLYVLSDDNELNEVILERRLNVIVFTVCWSLGSKMMLATLFDLSDDPVYLQMNFYRMDLTNQPSTVAQRLNIVVPGLLSSKFF